VLAVAACAGTPQSDRLSAAGAAGSDLPVRAELADVPFYPQEDDYCGPASLAMVLAWGGVAADQDEIAAEIYTPGRDGTLANDMLGGARRNGRLAVKIAGLDHVLAEIAAGHPVIVFQNLALEWYAQWHYAVAVGYDLEAGDIVLHSGLNARHVTPLTTFEQTWRRADYWALVVLPPDQLPATATEAQVVEAAVALERVGRNDEAAIAYGAIVERWPSSAGAWLGLGNLAYGRGDLAGATQAFGRATVADPDFGAAWNNLAVVLAEQGRPKAAIHAAETAIATGNGDLDEFRRTLEEVSAGS
jgi:tetratricopeptide (TPR) repeat protein